MEPIESQFLSSRDLIALEYAQGLTFHEIRETERTTYEEFSELEDVESGTNLDNGFQRLEDSNNDDVLHVPSEDDKTVMHVGIGIAPSILELFYAYPENRRDTGSFPNISNSPIPGDSGVDFGMIDGDMSPYRQPTARSEIVIPPKQHLQFDVFNPGSDDHEPLLKFEVMKYKVRPLELPRDKDAIQKAVKSPSPVPIKPIGTFESKADFNLESEWEVEPMTINQARTQIARANRSGR